MAVAVAAVMAALLALGGCALGGGASGLRASVTTFDNAGFEGAAVADAAKVAEPARVSFVAVGDNLIHGSIYKSYRTEDGFNFDPAYAPMKPYIEAADFAYINQETICGGVELELGDYPLFNSPHQILDAVAASGFDWINTASNHSLDVREAGILSQLDYLKGLPQLVQTGTHASAEDAATPTVVEINGIKIGLASYTYGLNGFELADGKEYLVDLIDREKIAADMAVLVEVSDVQLVCMHWGIENSHEPTDEEVELAQLLADLGVDVVVGGHPHVVQPTTYVTGSGGNKTLVIYSLGNYLSAQDEVPNMLGEMASWTLTYDFIQQKVGFESVEIWPTVTQIYPGWYGHTVYALRDYTDELASEHMLAPNMNRGALIEMATSVFGTEFPVIY
jgi:poly-gamma-glutamate synthesis protein (capsule biosynthesis protein)